MNFLVVVAIIGCLARVQGDLTLKVICDDISTIFVDGEQRDAAGTGAWNQLATLTIPDNTGAIGIQCRNTGGPYGIMAQVEDASGQVFEVTNNEWQCSNTAADGWATADFAGGWAAASYYNHPGYIHDQGAWRGMSPNKKIIWTNTAADTTVYCRKTMPDPNSNTLDVVCDDIANVFVDGEEKFADGNRAWNLLSSWRISPDASVIGVQCRNTGGPYGIMVELKNPQSRTIMVSDDTWHCSNSGDDGWATADFVENDNWQAASYYNHGAYAVPGGSWSGMSFNRKIIWTNSAADTTVYCRKVLVDPSTALSAMSGAWKVIPGGLNRISKGSAGTWGVNGAENIYRLRANGINWDQIGGALVQISSGKTVWGVNRHDMIYEWAGNHWVNIAGRLVNVDVSEAGNVWGVNRAGNLYRYQGNNAWHHIDGRGIQITTGGAGVWHVNSDNNIYYRTGTYGDALTDGDGWVHVPGKLKWIASGDNQLVGVNSNNDIFYREGLSADTPTGTRWVHVPGKLIMIDVFGNSVVGVNAANNIFRCAMEEPVAPVEWMDCDDSSMCLREPGTGNHLRRGVSMVSDNGRVKLEMQEDGNLVLKCALGGRPLWNTETSGDTELKIQPDGNMVMYEGDSVLWASGTDGNRDAVYLSVQDDHNLVLYNEADRNPLWHSDTYTENCPDVNYVSNCAGDSCVRAEQQASLLPLGHRLTSNNGRGVLTMQTDGNLVLRCAVNNEIVWQTETSGVDQGLRIESDGNLLMLDADRNVQWQSETVGHTEALKFIVQNDMNVVLYGGENLDDPYWHSDTYTYECIPGPSSTGTWARSEGKYLSGYSSGTHIYATLASAEENCAQREDCGGITWENINNRFTLRRGVQLRDSPSGEVSYIKLLSDDEGGHIFPAAVNTDYNLHKALEVGDVISAWFMYNDASTSKFSLNIMGQNRMFLIHVDFRPWINTLVLNSNVPGVGWQAEVRPAFASERLTAGLNKVSIEVMDGEYKVMYNNEEVGRFPQRQDISLASHIALYGGSNGFQWKAAQLPPSSVEPGMARPRKTNEEAHFDSPLESGDVVTVWGIYAADTEAYSINFITEGGDNMLHIAFRPAENQIVLNTNLNGGWQAEIRTPLPSLEPGRPFKVQVRCMDSEFEIYVDGNDIGARFPYREGFALSDVSYEISGTGSNGLEFTDMAPPADKSIGQNLMVSGLTVEQNTVGWGGVPERAIDGDVNGNYHAGSCSCSSHAANNWWRAQLNQISEIQKVVIWNRMDCCQERLNDAKVYAGDVLCGSVSVTVGNPRVEVSCGGVVANSIKIVQPYQYLTLCEVQVFGVPSDAVPLQNVALNKPASQTSVGWNGIASRGVDGRISGTWGHGTCTHSATNIYNEWSVNLLDQYTVNSVVIYNRRDCCQPRINGAKVLVDGELCGAVAYEAGVDVYTIDCEGRVGSEVMVTLAGDYLTLCEVQVIGSPSEEVGAYINVAENGVASQSSTGWNGVADRAIDGNADSNYWGDSCSHTGDINDGWWKLDFDEDILVNSVIIYNRADCCAERINGVQVYAGENLCGTISYVEGQAAYVAECPEHSLSNSVTIMAAEDQYLTLCEVKVMADPNPEVGSQHLVNLALNKPTSQSSTGWGGAAARGVDGRDSGLWGHGTCTHTNGAGWWMVNLQDRFTVQRVSIKNRMDCCSDRINGVQVYAGDHLCGEISYNAEILTYDVDCSGVVASTVKVVNPNTHLTLCEVRVWGPAEPIIVNDDDEEVVTGTKSAGVDDATSVAECPSGMVVTGCEVIEGGIGQISDGALVKGDLGNQCVAHCSWGSEGVTARAFCSVASTVTDPCNGPALPKYTKQYARGTNPSLSCPEGYVPEVCNVHSFWKQMLTNKGIEPQAYINVDSDCTIADCTDRNWCDITLVCSLVEDMDAYAAAVCPTCDGYTCGDGYECQMVDRDDDESDAAVPTCVLVQTGCDVDKCGEGDCEPVGANGYTCSCNDGYEFNVVAGTCMPVHSRYTTVYGEEAVGDDAHSYATCDQGQKVMRCHTYGAPGAADGVTITNNEGVSRCEARASHSRIYPVRAVAYCGDDTTFTDPCTQDEIHAVEYRYNSGLSPHVTCPDGYLMESCIFHSPWTQSLTAASRAKINSIGSVEMNEDGSCTMSDCLTNPHGHQWCKLTAVCKKLTGTEYLQAACPTCEQVRCGEDEECSMADDLPVCLVRVPGGCEEDKCSENGVCIEDGPNYECACSQGYRFDGVTCIDVDECAEDPCGNGVCTNTAGSYSCECSEGYELVHGTCEDINECLDSPCSDTERCSNVEGSYICDCLDTFVRDSSNECVCADGYQNQDGACVDIDECADDPCGENEFCTNSVGNYLCECVEEAELNEHGECFIYQPLECDVGVKKSNIMGIKGNNVNVKLKGESKKVFKKYSTISWTKNGDAWNPKSSGKEKFNGFTIRNFAAEDAGVYVGSIFIDMNGEQYKCDVEVNIELLEGSVNLSIANMKALSRRQRAGQPLSIRCDADIVNLKLDDPKSENNVNWYRVTDDGDVLLEDDGNYEIARQRGSYQLTILNPTRDDSGTYRCEFDQFGVDASTEVTIEVK